MVELKSETVKLPEGFKVEQNEKDGKVEFKFSSPVELHFTEESLKQYTDWYKDLTINDFASKSVQYEFREQEPDIGLSAQEVLKAALPDVIGNNGFYKPTRLDEFVGARKLNLSKLKLTHSTEKRNADLEIILHRGESLSPESDKNSNIYKRPFIDGGYIKGYVLIKANIPLPGQEGYIYDIDASAAIIAALEKGKNLSLSEDEHIKGSSFTNRNYEHFVYFQISNPIKERIEKAMEYSEQISDFFIIHIGNLQKIAEIYSEAEKIEEHKKEIEDDYHSMVSSVKKARKELNSRITLPQKITTTINDLNYLTSNKLKEADKDILELSKNFPKGILEYAIPMAKDNLW
jgi:hypothetical protein